MAPAPPAEQPTPAVESRAVRFCIDTTALTPRQTGQLDRSAGAARQAWNWALGHENTRRHLRHEFFTTRALAEAGGDQDAAEHLIAEPAWRRKTFRAMPPDLAPYSSARASRDYTAEAKDPDSRIHWWHSERGGVNPHGVNRFTVTTALRDLEAAFTRFRNPPTPATARRPRKDGHPAGYPRFKKKGRCRDSFALFNLIDAHAEPCSPQAWKVVEHRHWLRLPNLGRIRVHEDTKRLRRMIARGGLVKGAHITRHGTRWYVAITITVPATEPARPTRSQRAAGAIGVDLGVKSLATYSTGEVVENPRWQKNAQAKTTRLQRSLARKQGPTRQCPTSSKRWGKAKARLSRHQHDLATRRVSALHLITKKLATGFAVVGVEDLNVQGMTASPLARPDPDHPGQYLANGKAAKSGLSKAILDVGFYEFRRQLAYKTRWHGSVLVPVARFAPTSKTCSRCGAVKPTLSLSERTYHCSYCGLVTDRDLNAAYNIRDLAVAATVPVGHGCGTTLNGQASTARAGTPAWADRPDQVCRGIPRDQRSEETNSPPLPKPKRHQAVRA